MPVIQTGQYDLHYPTESHQSDPYNSQTEDSWSKSHIVFFRNTNTLLQSLGMKFHWSYYLRNGNKLPKDNSVHASGTTTNMFTVLRSFGLEIIYA